VKELAHKVEKSGKRNYTMSFCSVRIHGNAECWSSTMKELVGKLGGSEDPVAGALGELN
jgi:hypothetical protein